MDVALALALMRYLAALVLLAVPVAAPTPAEAEEKPKPPAETAQVLAMMGRFTSGHGCPVTPTLALTASHMTDVTPFGFRTTPAAYRWSMLNAEGSVEPIGKVSSADLGVVETDVPFPAWNKAAIAAPAVGDYLWLVGYDWDNKEKGYAAEVIRVRVTRVVAGHVIYHPAGKPGSSGSCVWNQDGQVVAINVWGQDVGTDEVGIGVGIWRPWFDQSKLE